VSVMKATQASHCVTQLIQSMESSHC